MLKRRLARRDVSWHGVGILIRLTSCQRFPIWKVRSRVYRWYGTLRAVEQAIEDVPPQQRASVYQEQLRRLDDIEERANHVSIPLSFAEELYGLRSHINLVRKRILWLMQRQPGA